MPDIQQTALALKQHDDLLRFSLFSTAALSLMTRRMGSYAGFFSAYLLGARQVPYQAHQQALQANRTFWGRTVVDPYPGFFNSADFSGAADTAKKQYENVATMLNNQNLLQQVDELIKSTKK